MNYQQLLLSIIFMSATQPLSADLSRLKTPQELQQEYTTIKRCRNVALVSIVGVTKVVFGIADNVKEDRSLYRQVVLFAFLPATMFTITAGILHWDLKKLEKQHPEIDF